MKYLATLVLVITTYSAQGAAGKDSQQGLSLGAHFSYYDQSGPHYGAGLGGSLVFRSGDKLITLRQTVYHNLKDTFDCSFFDIISPFESCDSDHVEDDVRETILSYAFPIVADAAVPLLLELGASRTDFSQRNELVPGGIIGLRFVPRGGVATFDVGGHLNLNREETLFSLSLGVRFGAN